jgi:hypothetical protein
MKKIITFCSIWAGLSMFYSTNGTAQSQYTANQSVTAPLVDGKGTDACWQQASWKSIDQLWLGTAPSSSDFQGKYKVTWNGNKIYILAEIVDDVLYDGHTDPLDQWYNDDCIEIFLDEDHSKGDHQCNYNAFAYHVAINGDVVDLGKDCNPRLYNSAVTSARTNVGSTYTWELAITVYSSTYTDLGPNTPVSLFDGKISGLSLAYCDDDGSNTRESFIGSEVMPVGHNDDNYKTADYFGILNLMGPVTTGFSDEEVLQDEPIWERYIYNSLGQLLTQEVQPYGNDLPVSSFPIGIYIVKTLTESGFKTKKVLVK